jgi:uncharacterized membrane protein
MEISMVEPLKNLSPLFLVVLAFFFLGEQVTLMNLLGVIIIVIGAYIVEVDHSFFHVIQNLKIMRNKHMNKIILSQVLLAFCAIIDKYLIGFIDVYTLLFFNLWMMFINLFMVFTFKYNGYHGLISSLKKNSFWVFLSGIFRVGADLSYLYALSLPGALVALVIPIKRFSTIITTIIGGEMFHDHGMRTRIIGAAITVIGVLLVIL